VRHSDEDHADFCLGRIADDFIQDGIIISGLDRKASLPGKDAVQEALKTPIVRKAPSGGGRSNGSFGGETTALCHLSAIQLIRDANVPVIITMDEQDRVSQSLQRRFPFVPRAAYQVTAGPVFFAHTVDRRIQKGSQAAGCRDPGSQPGDMVRIEWARLAALRL
jgi:hypothetical protein